MSKKQNIVVVAALFAVMLTGLTVYLSSSTTGPLGSPAAGLPKQNSRVADNSDNVLPKQAGSIGDLVGPLKRRLEENPNDPSSWVLLGKSYEYLGRPEDASSAFLKAIEYGSSDPSATTALSTTAIKTDRASLDSKTMLAVGRVLGTDVFEKPSVVIHGQIDITDELRKQIEPQHRLFVFAKQPGGLHIPLAVMKTQATELPLIYRLDDSMSMVTGKTLAKASNVQVTARISMTGNVSSRAGDFYATSPILTLSANNKVDLLIDQILQP